MCDLYAYERWAVLIISSDLAFNSILYRENKISEKFYSKKSLLKLSLTNNKMIIIISSFIGLILKIIFSNLYNSSNSIRTIFNKEERKLVDTNKYTLTKSKIRNIIKRIEDNINSSRIRIIIVLIINLLILIFFWFYASLFCFLFKETQYSWLINGMMSIILRIIIIVLSCFFFSIIYKISIWYNLEYLYDLSLVIYNYI